jgi:MYXO-CTERM domain-containing protein
MQALFHALASLLSIAAAPPRATLVPGYVVRPGVEASRVLAEGRGAGVAVRLERRALSVHAIDGSDIVLSFDRGAARAPVFAEPLEAQLHDVRPDRTVSMSLFARATVERVWPGIDLVLRSVDGAIAVDLAVAPGADLSRVGFVASGRVELDRFGAARVETDSGVLQLSKPIAWQEGEGDARRAVAVSFMVRGRRIGFTVGPSDPSRPIYIDPVVTYASYVTPGSSYYYAAANDASFVYLATIASLGAPADPDLYVAKIDPTKTGTASLVWASSISGPGTNGQSGIFVRDADVDPMGRLVVCGSQLRSFVSTDLVDSMNQPLSGNAIAVIVSASGTQLEQITSFGDGEFAGCTFDPGASTYWLTGRIDSNAVTHNPLTGGAGVAYLGHFNADDNPAANNDSILFGSQLASGTTTGERVLIAPNGEVDVLMSAYTIGGTDLTPWVDAMAFQTRRDDFGVCRFAMNATSVLGCTYIGGTGSEGGGIDQGAIVIDPSGDIFILINSSSQDYARAPNDPAPTSANFLALSRVSGDLHALHWTRFFASGQSAGDLDLLPNGEVALLNQQPVGNWPTTSCNVGSSGSTSLAVVSNDGQRTLFSTYTGVWGRALAHFGDQVVVFGPSSGSLDPYLNGFLTTGGSSSIEILDPGATCADLALTAEGPSSSITAGDLFHWTANILNTDSTSAAADVRFDMRIPANAQLLVAQPSAGTCAPGANASCALGALAASATAAVDLTLLALEPGSAVASGTVSTSVVDLNRTNDHAQFTAFIGAGAGPCLNVGMVGRCMGTTLEMCAMIGTPQAQIVRTDCAALPNSAGAICAFVDLATGFACENLGPGAPCDAQRRCAAGLSCTGGSCVGPPDAGVPDTGSAGDGGAVSDAGGTASDGGGGSADGGQAGTDAGSTKRSSGCSCSASGGERRTSALAIIGIFAGLAIRRSRCNRRPPSFQP